LVDILGFLIEEYMYRFADKLYAKLLHRQLMREQFRHFLFLIAV